MALENSHAKRLRSIFVLDSMGSRSHTLLNHIFVSPELKTIYHPFVNGAYMGEKRWIKGARVSEARRKEIMEDMLPMVGPETLRSCAIRYAREIAETSQKGLIPITNEHVFSILEPESLFNLHRHQTKSTTLAKNPTCIPDPIFATMTPVLLIRHPVLHIDTAYQAMIGSMKIRAGDEDFEIMTSHRLLRCMYDHLKAQGSTPVVVDGEDVVTRTEVCITRLCNALGLDGARISDIWDSSTEEQRQKNIWSRIVGLNITQPAEETSGKRCVDGLDLDEAYKKWYDKYGQSEATKLRRLAETNLPDYEYLSQYKI